MIARKVDEKKCLESPIPSKGAQSRVMLWTYRYGKQGCDLCDEAMSLVAKVLIRNGACQALGIEFDEEMDFESLLAQLEEKGEQGLYDGLDCLWFEDSRGNGLPDEVKVGDVTWTTESLIEAGIAKGGEMCFPELLLDNEDGQMLTYADVARQLRANAQFESTKS